ncbi:MAG: DUF4263 domain-containing protein [Betaproteobacteria bacterium]|nr:MAG: DUF4263 domain-containing protein [Betaproteobacteria bacterium]
MKANNWKQAERHLREATKSVTEKQKQVAAVAGITIGERTPRIVAAAKLRAALTDELHLAEDRPVQEHAQPVIERLWPGKTTPAIAGSDGEADAWIEHLFLLKRRAAISKLQPEPGDIVVTQNGSHAEISSIGLNGRLYFTGGNGRGSWPDNVTIMARSGDESRSAKEARRKAGNEASLSSRAVEWTYARDQDLRDFRVMNKPAKSDLLGLEEVIEASQDERPIQKFLQEHPALLTLLVQGTDCFVIPQKRLGSEYVPDFVVAFVDSAGIHWHLVELESPRAPMFTKDGTAFGKECRKGINQIADWREWLDGNVAYARKPLSDHGLGLFDIRNDAPGVVLVGRRSTLSNKSESLRNHQRTSGIMVHTYDWLIESLRGSIEFTGPAPGNPFAIKQKEKKSWLDQI